MKNSRRNTEDTSRNRDNTKETQKNNKEKNFNLKTGYCILKFFYRHNIHNPCDFEILVIINSSTLRP